MPLAPPRGSEARSSARPAGGALRAAEVERAGREAGPGEPSARARPRRVAGAQARVQAAGPAALEVQPAGGAGRHGRPRDRGQRAQQAAQRRRRAEVLAEGRDAAAGDREDHRQVGIGLGREGEPGLQRRVGGAGRPPHRAPARPAHAMRAQREVRHDAEAAAAAAQRPEEVRVVGGVDPSPPAVGGDDRQGHDVVERQPEGAAGEPHAAAERQPAEPDRRARAGRDGDAVGGQGRVDVDELRAGAGADPPAAVAQAHGAQAAQVEHDARVGRRVARVAVAARAGHDGHVVPSRPADGRLHVADVAGPDDGDRVAAVPARVVDVRRRAEAALPGRQDGPPHRGRQRAQPPAAPRPAGRPAGRRERQRGGERDAAGPAQHLRAGQALHAAQPTRGAVAPLSYRDARCAARRSSPRSAPPPAIRRSSCGWSRPAWTSRG